MAPFDDARARKMKDEEESFLDWEGEATLFQDDEEVEEADEESASLDDEEEDEAWDDEDDEVEELDFG